MGDNDCVPQKDPTWDAQEDATLDSQVACLPLQIMTHTHDNGFTGYCRVGDTDCLPQKDPTWDAQEDATLDSQVHR